MLLGSSLVQPTKVKPSEYGNGLFLGAEQAMKGDLIVGKRFAYTCLNDPTNLITLQSIRVILYTPDLHIGERRLSYPLDRAYGS